MMTILAFNRQILSVNSQKVQNVCCCQGSFTFTVLQNFSFETFSQQSNSNWLPTVLKTIIIINVNDDRYYLYSFPSV